MAAAFPPVSELLPQAGAMVLLDRVVEHASRHTICQALVDRLSLFRDRAGRVPAFVGIELMAQTMAAHRALALATSASRATGSAGLFLGSRRVLLHTPAFRPGQVLDIRAEHVHGDSRLVAFQCWVHDAVSNACLVEGQLNALSVDVDSS